jgi:site-specific DNA-methyltransferase (adenine-specific)
MTTAPARPSRRPRHPRKARAADDPSAQLSLPGNDRPRIAPALQALAVPIESITLHPRNPRIGDVEAVAASLQRFGQLKPLVVQASTRFVVAGNHLLRAAQKLGWTSIAANVEAMDDATATAYGLADNRTADLGDYDYNLLAAMLAEEEAADNLAATGYDADDVAALLRAVGQGDERDPDAVPDLPPEAEVYVHPGDLWALGQHRLLVGDATDPDAVARLTADAPVDLVFTDPPYGVGYTGGTPAHLTISNDDLDADGTRALVADALRLAPLRPGGAFYVMAPAGPLHLSFLLALADAGLTLYQTLIWVKSSFVLGHGDYHYRHEPMLYGWRDGGRHLFRGDRTEDSVWEIPRPARSELHPTMKPVELVERAIRNSSMPGERVLDMFAGSGTTLIAAERAERICLAMELDPRYAQVAIERWRSFTGQTPRRVA